MEVDALLDNIDNTSRKRLVQDIAKESNFLAIQREDITNLWDLDERVPFASFYETQNTKTAGKVG